MRRPAARAAAVAAVAALLLLCVVCCVLCVVCLRSLWWGGPAIFVTSIFAGIRSAGGRGQRGGRAHRPRAVRVRMNLLGLPVGLLADCMILQTHQTSHIRAVSLVSLLLRCVSFSLVSAYIRNLVTQSSVLTHTYVHLIAAS